jgi:cell division protein FtsX
MRNQRTPLKNRSERSGNLVSIEAHDLTSRAYSKDVNQRPQTSFSAYLTVAVLVFLVIFFAGIYELVMETWKQLK